MALHAYSVYSIAQLCLYVAFPILQAMQTVVTRLPQTHLSRLQCQLFQLLRRAHSSIEKHTECVWRS